MHHYCPHIFHPDWVVNGTYHNGFIQFKFIDFKDLLYRKIYPWIVYSPSLPPFPWCWYFSTPGQPFIMEFCGWRLSRSKHSVCLRPGVGSHWGPAFRGAEWQRDLLRGGGHSEYTWGDAASDDVHDFLMARLAVAGGGCDPRTPCPIYHSMLSVCLTLIEIGI